MCFARIQTQDLMSSSLFFLKFDQVVSVSLSFSLHFRNSLFLSLTNPGYICLELP